MLSRVRPFLVILILFLVILIAFPHSICSNMMGDDLIDNFFTANSILVGGKCRGDQEYSRYAPRDGAGRHVSGVCLI
jgi:hypothetical protein